MLFSIINPYHEDGGIFGFVCFGILLISWIGLSLNMVGRHNQRTPARASQQGSTGLPGYDSRLGLPPLRGLSLLSEKRRLSEAVYPRPIEMAMIGAMQWSTAARARGWELDICGVVSELAEPENPYNPPYEKKAREIAEAIGIEFRIVQD